MFLPAAFPPVVSSWKLSPQCSITGGFSHFWERTLPMALFPKVWGTARYTAVTKRNLLAVAGCMVMVSS